MKKIVIILAALFLLQVSLFAYTESEFNDIWQLSDPIGVGSYIVLVDGVLQSEVDIDWFDYLANIQNNVIVTIVWATAPGLAVNVWQRQFLGDNPGSFVVATLVWPGPQLSVPFGALITERHYIEVFSMYGFFPITYQIMIQNANDPTLPITLSGFSATQSGEFVGLRWITQTETGMSGYNVLRSDTADLESAVQINPSLILATNTSTTQSYSYIDNEVDMGSDYYYWLEAVNIDGSNQVFGSVLVQTQTPPDDPGTPVIPTQTRLLSPFPNPFSSNATLRLELAEKSNVSLGIFNIRGQKIRSIHTGELESGSHQFNWDGQDEAGENVTSGVYLVRMQTGDDIQYTRLTIRD